MHERIPLLWQSAWPHLRRAGRAGVLHACPAAGPTTAHPSSQGTQPRVPFRVPPLFFKPVARDHLAEHRRRPCELRAGVGGSPHWLVVPVTGSSQGPTRMGLAAAHLPLTHQHWG